MATFVLTDAFVKIGTVDLVGQTTNVAISYKANAVDVTSMGSETKVNIGGTKEWSMSIDANADEAITGALFDLVGQTADVEVRASSAIVGPSNPSYKGTALITELTPISGGVGDAHRVSISLVSSGDLSRVTA